MPRRCAFDDRKARHAERGCVAPDARGAIGSLSMAMARSDGSASIHSMATEPAPAPMSQSNSPRHGASADSVSARISRLVIWPSCSKQVVAEAGRERQYARTVRRLDFDRDDVERVGWRHGKTVGAG